MADESLDELEQASWGGFLRTHERLWRALESSLSAVGLSMAEYDVLIALHDAGSGGLRMSDLAARRLMSTGGFTRLADRLEGRGLIERRRAERDARSLNARLTREGRALLRRARVRHHRDVRALFVDRLGREDLELLTSMWRRLDPDDEANDC